MNNKLRIPRSFREKDVKRSVWQLGKNVQTTFKQCLNTPLFFEVMKPTDKFSLDYATLIQSMPMNAQLISDWKMRVMVFKSDLSNYYSWMDNNSRLTSAQLKNRKHHRISNYRLPLGAVREFASQMFDDTDRKFDDFSRFIGSVLPSFTQGDVGSRNVLFTPEWLKVFGVQPESLLDFIGFPAEFAPSYWSNSGQTVSELPPDFLGASFNADYLLVYLDVVRNYCVNNQLDSVPYFCAIPSVVISSDLDADYTEFDVIDFKPYFSSIPLEELDEFFKRLRCEDDGVDLLKFCFDQNFYNIQKWLVSLRFGGLFLAQYERDMLNGLLRKVDTSDAEVTVTTDENGVQSFTINAFRLKNREQLYNDRVDVAGGRWTALLRTLWGAKGKSRVDIPMLVGTTSYMINSKGVTSTSDTSAEGGANIGQIASVTNTFDRNQYRHKVYADDHSILMIMVSMVPDVTYQNGLGKGLDNLMFADEYYPQFDQLGFQDVPLYKYNSLPHHVDDLYPGGVVGRNLNITDNTQTNDFLRVVGKNIAFIDLISNVSRVHGKFSNDEYFESWVLKRTFAQDVTYPLVKENGNVLSVPSTTPVKDVTSYANPLDYQYPFVTQGPLDSNFVLQLGIDLRADRPKGKRYMPTLGK